MTQATPSETAQGYERAPSVTQFSVFLDNRVGRLHELLLSFEDHQTCQVCAFSVNEASDYAVIRIITNLSKEARNLLRGHGLTFTETEILVVEVPEEHSLSRMCLHLLGAELNIEFAYPVLLKPNGAPTIAIAVDDMTLAGQILRRKGFRMLGEGDLPKRSQL